MAQKTGAFLLGRNCKLARHKDTNPEITHPIAVRFGWSII